MRMRASQCLGHDRILVDIQQLAALATHKCFIVGDHLVLITIRCKKGFGRGDVVEPSLGDAIEARRCCPRKHIVTEPELVGSPIGFVSSGIRFHT